MLVEKCEEVLVEKGIILEKCWEVGWWIINPKGMIGAEEKDLENLQMIRLGSRVQGFDYEKR
jgi:streptomycin 6-kinase